LHISVCPAVAEDAPQIAAMNDSCFGLPCAVGEVARQIRAILNSPDERLLVAVHRGIMLGYIHLRVDRRTYRAPRLAVMAVAVDKDHPLFVYIPCGVGGAPGGVGYGLKQLFGDEIHLFFVEPVQAACMLAGMASNLHSRICVQDLGLHGCTEADGLAVGRPSGFVGGVMQPHLSGEVTLEDYRLYDLMRAMLDTENIFLEPSACAGFWAPVQLKSDEMQEYIRKNGLQDKMQNAAHVVWATGGSLVPDDVREKYLKHA